MGEGRDEGTSPTTLPSPSPMLRTGEGAKAPDEGFEVTPRKELLRFVQLFIAGWMRGLEVRQELAPVLRPFRGVGARLTLFGIVGQELPNLFAFGLANVASRLAHHLLHVAFPYARLAGCPSFDLPNQLVLEHLGMSLFP